MTFRGINPTLAEGEHTLLFTAAGLMPGAVISLLEVPAGYLVTAKGTPSVRPDGLIEAKVIITKDVK